MRIGFAIEIEARMETEMQLQHSTQEKNMQPYQHDSREKV